MEAAVAQLTYYPGICLETENPQKKKLPGQPDSNQAPPEHKSRALPLHLPVQ
jgi:hypothetical protein